MNPEPNRRSPAVLPYGRQWIEEDDIAAVAAVLRGDWLTTGPHVAAFERDLAAAAGAREAVAVSSGTAALHASMYALGIGPGDEVVVPALTFAATANAVVFQGGTPVFADVEPDTLLIDPDRLVERITPRTRAVVAVDYAGQPCDYTRLQPIADAHGLPLVADACHSLGAAWNGRPVGSLARLSTFSFHPVKAIATGEGGMIATEDAELARRLRLFRNHGITTDHRQREQAGSWFYEMVDLGYNYRLSDLQCALGISQLRKLPCWIARRQAIAERYRHAFAGDGAVQPLAIRAEAAHAYHLFVVQLGRAVDRGRVFNELRARGIGVNVHYVPVHLHPFYRKRFGTQPGLCPVAEAAYERILSLPIFPRMSDEHVTDVITAVESVVGSARRSAA